MKRTVAFLDIKNVAVITWTDNHEAELDASIFWNLSPSILQNQFIVLYFHLLVVVIKESKPASVRVKLRNADFLPFWLTFLLPRFSLSSKGKLVFQLLHQRFPNKTIQSFPDRIAANFALSILPEWLESKRIQELAADIAQCAHYAIVYLSLIHI